MDRGGHLKYVPQCPSHAGIVDQYMWPEKDTNAYRCYNGISHPIYDCKGWVNFSLPLEHYPPVNDVHPQIKMIDRMHLNYREPIERVGDWREGYEKPQTQRDERLEGFYRGLPQGSVAGIISNRVPGYPLPSPHGDTRSSRSCI